MLYYEFDDLLPETYKNVDLYPTNLRQQIDTSNEWIYNDVNNGVYKSGFATTQDAYEEAVTTLFSSLDKIESHLATQASSRRSSSGTLSPRLISASSRLSSDLILCTCSTSSAIFGILFWIPGYSPLGERFVLGSTGVPRYYRFRTYLRNIIRSRSTSRLIRFLLRLLDRCRIFCPRTRRLTL